MEGPEIIAISVIALILSGAIFYIVKAKKSGRKCIGCPHGGKCGSAKDGGNSCSSCKSCSGYNCGCGGDCAETEE